MEEQQWLIENGFEEEMEGFRWTRPGELGVTVMKYDGGWCAIAFNAASGASAMSVFKDLEVAVVEALKALKEMAVHVEVLAETQLGIFKNKISYDVGHVTGTIDGH